MPETGCRSWSVDAEPGRSSSASRCRALPRRSFICHPGLIGRVKHLRGEEDLRHASLQDFREE
ncbi:MAG: hypothetical protein E5V49_09465 [Mesorhizobium sp.]|nr:hypothetical protein EN848_12970 [bacterium M00.F.Ca.ET.205.01.1.1]TGU47481.1 hypothetical protein EN795_29565 [bacterium M00.F.Ca.ET.152.01.1.1]TGV32182.1 hypothetical protein EN829_029105 [Mesorhizobium sp. M00.F.Ca.ET.186.01.1.1]TGZ39258.1 hypothetical protein EN805_29675 [bacterium M00.F.Ca.ET.162.01.1.1]TIW60815.1 MAG: hypothetical protein E5V48_12060 [Mesorhizobium sp.]